MKYLLLGIICLSSLSCDRDSDSNVYLSNLCDGRVLIHDNELYDDGIQDPTTSINGIRFTPPCLHINLSYGGGCQDHDISLVLGTHVNSRIDGPLQQLFTKVIHDNQDACEALITEDLEFDLSKVLDLYDQQSFTLFILNGDSLHSLNIDF